MPRASFVRAALLVALGTSAVAPLRAAGAPPPTTAIGEIKKEHNVDMPDGRKAVRLTVPAEISGQQGKTVWVAVWFTDLSEKPIASNDPAYADASGNLKVVSADTTLSRDPESQVFTFLVPYAAFPKHKEGKYQVIAHAKLVRRDTPKNVVLATGATSFAVEG